MLTFDIINDQSDIKIQVYDEGKISDTLIGEMEITLKSLISGENIYDIEYNGKKEGEIMLKT